MANLSLTPEKGGETSIGTSRFPLNKLLKQFIIKIVTKMRKIFHFHLITFLLFCPFLPAEFQNIANFHFFRVSIPENRDEFWAFVDNFSEKDKLLASEGENAVRKHTAVHVIRYEHN